VDSTYIENRTAGETRPWWRQRWLTIAAGYSFAFLTGMAVAAWAERQGGWQHGTDWERSLMRAAHLHLPGWLDEIILASPWLGTNISLIPGVLIGVWWLWARLKRPHLAMRLLVVQLGSYILNPALKDLYDRPRPDLFPREYCRPLHGRLDPPPRARLDVDVLGPHSDLAVESLLTHLPRRSLADRCDRGRACGNSLARDDEFGVQGTKQITRRAELQKRRAEKGESKRLVVFGSLF
jgi:hypothetical protein